MVMHRRAALWNDDSGISRLWSRGLRSAIRAGLCTALLVTTGPGLLLAAVAQAEPDQSSEQAAPLAPLAPLALPASPAPPAGERQLAQGAQPSDPGFGGGPGVARFQLSPEQREKLRVARESEVRKLLGLKPGDPLPRVDELTDAQKKTIFDAREAELRRVLGLGPEAPLPNRENVSDEQRQLIAGAHEARIREALGLAPDAPLPLAEASPASGDSGAAK